jgi:hypothetical protein
MEPVVGHDLSSIFTAEMMDYRVCDQQSRIRAYERVERIYHFLADQESAQHESCVFRKGEADPAEDEREEKSKIRKMLCGL